jgi:deazaflavin-dependent oxidoreductase (nitroreductase family)
LSALPDKALQLTGPQDAAHGSGMLGGLAQAPGAMGTRQLIAWSVGRRSGSRNLAAETKSKAAELFWFLHPRIHRWSGGRIGGRLRGLPVLLLTTTGRRTSKSRTTALTYLPKGESCVIIASYAGEPRHPAWFLNLRNSPQIEIQIGSRRIPVLAREAAGEERSRLWNDAVSKIAD